MTDLNVFDRPIDPIQDAIRDLAAGAPTDNGAIPTLVQLAAAEEARNQLAQASFVANPAEMRKFFPKVVQDLNDRYPYGNSDNIDMRRIDLGLQDPGFPQEDKNLLTVFKAGYKVLSESPYADVDSTDHLKSDQKGISAQSLAVMDKALNRGINEDPYFAQHMVNDPWQDALSFALVGAAFVGINSFSEKGALMGATVFGAMGGALGLVRPLIMKFGFEDQMYDNVKADYLTLKDAFNKTPVGNESRSPKAWGTI